MFCVCVPVLQEREGRKDMEPRSEDGHFEEVSVQQLPQVERGGNPVSIYACTQTHTHVPDWPPIKYKPLPLLSCVQDKTVEIAVRLSPKQLDHVAPVLEEIIHEIVEERQKGTSICVVEHVARRVVKKASSRPTRWPCISFYYPKMISRYILTHT